MVDLKVVAVAFLDRGLPWPDHNNEHTRTIARDRMMDSTCLRCVLESTLEAQAKERHTFARRAGSFPRILTFRTYALRGS